MTSPRTSIVATLLTLAVLWSAPTLSQDTHDHDHEQSTVADEEYDHGSHDETVDEEGQVYDHGHAEHDEEILVDLTPEAISLAGIATSVVRRGTIVRTIELPGEVGFNEDRLVHIAPRFAGIALQVMKRVGDRVSPGEIVAVIESNESMNPYSIESPISGWVIQRHITPGEFVSEQSSIFVIADLSTVWVDLAVYPKDADRIRRGQTARLRAVGSDLETEGVIEYVTPIMDVHTRSLTARVVLPNQDNAWRPGFFVQATVQAESEAEGLLVEKTAVQHLDGQSVVFVPDGPGRYRPVEVTTGSGDRRHVRITAGLEDGSVYVSEGAFELKAKIVTGSLGGHAGHGH